MTIVYQFLLRITFLQRAYYIFTPFQAKRALANVEERGVIIEYYNTTKGHPNKCIIVEMNSVIVVSVLKCTVSRISNKIVLYTLK